MKKLGDVIDLKVWKKIQDNFSKAIGHTVYTADPIGEEVIVSKEFPFLCQIVKSKKYGKDMCKSCRIEQFEKLKSQEEKILFYSCHCGLLNVMVPLIVNNEQVGSVVCSSLVRENRNFPKCRATAKLIGVEPDELADALGEMKETGSDELKSIGKMLYVLSTTVPELAHQKVASDKKISELTVLHKIAQMVNSTLDLDKILKPIMSFMLQSVKAKTCSIFIFDGKKRYSLEEPTNDLRKLEHALAVEASQTKLTVRVPRIKNDFRFENLEVPYNSVISIPLKMKDEVMGVINLFGDSINLDENDIEFLSIVSNQAAMAIGNAKQYEQIRESAITDKLTGLYNRRHFMSILQSELERSKRTRKPVSIALFDIDDFKHYNDTQGHVKGDKLLQELGMLLMKQVRTIDTVGRYGGEEFIVVLPETKLNEAKVVAERVRKSIEDHHFESEEGQPSGSVTISLGLVTCMNGTLTVEEMIKESDRNLYKAKAAGKNRIVSTVILDRSLKPVEVFD